MHKFLTMSETMRIPDAKAAVDEEWVKLENIPAWQLTKVRNKKRGDRRSKESKKNSTLYVICHLKNSELEPQFHKYKELLFRCDIAR